MTTVVSERVSDIEAAARRLAAANREAAPETEAIYFFRADDEIRLIETDPTTIPSQQIVPYYFGADPRSDIPFRSAIALIRPEEAPTLPPPAGWGTWQEAIRLWPEE